MLRNCTPVFLIIYHTASQTVFVTSASLRNDKIWMKFHCVCSNPVKLTAGSHAWTITGTNSVLCTLEHSAVLRSSWNSITSPLWQLWLQGLLHQHKLSYLQCPTLHSFFNSSDWTAASATSVAVVWWCHCVNDAKRHLVTVIRVCHCFQLLTLVHCLSVLVTVTVI